MHLRPVHSTHHLPTLHTFIQQHPLGILTTAIPHPTNALLQSSHIPFILDRSPSPGILRGHIARANPQAQSLIYAATSNPNTTGETPSSTPSSPPPFLDQEVLILFTGPTHYITPHWYTTTKPSTSKVVPTWNYAAVQVYGRARLYHDPRDPATDAFLTRQVADLSAFAEGEVMGFVARPWRVEDAPARYVEALKKGIVGIEVVVERVAGKWKMSQEMGEGDREGVVEGLEGLGTEMGALMARGVREGRGVTVERRDGEEGVERREEGEGVEGEER